MIDKSKTYLVTGVAGFIGFFVCKKLLENGCKVIGIDNLNDYYEVNLKKHRLEILTSYYDFKFQKMNIASKVDVINLFHTNRFHYVIHLAAQAGVRYSIDYPDAYIESNINGFYNILEACRQYPVEHLLYASSSSVYGANKKVPFEETDFADTPVSLYAATKKSNELMAHAYSHLYNIPASGLRFFTVYGPMGRPDMAYFKFTNMFFNNKNIKIYNNGDHENDMYRDFTYIDDVVEGILRLLVKPPLDIGALHKIYNIGNNSPEKLMNFITTLEKCLGNSLGKEVRFKKIYEPIKPGDVHKTYSSTSLLEKEVGFKPITNIDEGLQKFTDWYVNYYKKV